MLIFGQLNYGFRGCLILGVGQKWRGVAYFLGVAYRGRLLIFWGLRDRSNVLDSYKFDKQFSPFLLAKTIKIEIFQDKLFYWKKIARILRDPVKKKKSEEFLFEGIFQIVKIQ